MAGIRAGALNRLVSIQSRSSTKDSRGGQSLTWTEIKQVYAHLEVLGLSEKLEAGALQTDVTHQITVRYDAALWADPKLAATYRVVYNGRYFDIKGIENADERDRIVVLNAGEGLSAG